MTHSIIEQLWDYFPNTWNDDERAHVLKTIDFIQRTPQAFVRDHETLGHVGASALVWNPTNKKVLLTVHSVTGERSFFGNHLDGNDDFPGMARERVAKEISPQFAAELTLQTGIFDVDVHYVPPHERQGEPVPAHLHYDLMYLFITSQNEDIKQAKWFTVAEALFGQQNSQQMQRLLTKLDKIG